MTFEYRGKQTVKKEYNRVISFRAEKELRKLMESVLEVLPDINQTDIINTGLRRVLPKYERMAEQQKAEGARA